MSLDPEDPRQTLQRNVERLLRNIVWQRHPATHFAEPVWAPAVDVVVSDRLARVIVDLAGVPRENVHVRLQGSELEISGQREHPYEQGDAHYHLAEILFGDFHRVVELPWEADADRVEALYRDGMLEIRLVRTPAERTRRIDVVRHRSK